MIHTMIVHFNIAIEDDYAMAYYKFVQIANLYIYINNSNGEHSLRALSNIQWKWNVKD